MGKRSRRIGTNLGEAIETAAQEKARILAAKSRAAGDNRTQAQREYQIDWSERGRALRAELIAAGVLLPPGYPRAVLEVDRVGVEEAARTIFFDERADLSGRFDVDERVQECVHDWVQRQDGAEFNGEPFERPEPRHVLPHGYEREFFDWIREQERATGSRRYLEQGGGGTRHDWSSVRAVIAGKVFTADDLNGGVK